MSSSGKITLRSSDGDTFEVDEAVAVESQTIKHMIEDDCAENAIPLPNVTSKILAKVIEYCKKHVDSSNSEGRATEEELKTWDAEFVKVDQATLFDLILVSDSLSPIDLFLLWLTILLRTLNMAVAEVLLRTKGCCWGGGVLWGKNK